MLGYITSFLRTLSIKNTNNMLDRQQRTEAYGCLTQNTDFWLELLLKSRNVDRSTNNKNRPANLEQHVR